MILEQHYLGCLAQASYLIADEESGVAAVVDPRRDVDVYLERAEALGVEIRHVLLTHFHADFLAGHIELRERTGAKLYLGARAEAEYAFTPLAEGDEVLVGRVRLSILETPGHTPEGISIVVHDPARGDAPVAVLTGDTLFVGDVGRPDLMASVAVTAEELGSMLFHSLHEKLLRLPDETLLYPGHGAGSMCGKNLGKETFSTIGAQRRTNYACQPMSRTAFVRLVAADQPEAPAYFSYDASLNRAERPTLEATLDRVLVPLAVDEVVRLQNAGAQLLDARDADAHAARHPAGAVNVGLNGSFATWCGTLLDAGRPIVLLTDPGREQEAALRLGRIGFDRIAGFVESGIDAYASRPDLLRHAARLSTAELRAELAGGAPPLVLDVRTPGERECSAIPGSLHVPLARLQRSLAEIPRGRELVTVCKGGYRSSSAASLLRQQGYGPVRDLVGGMDAWEAAPQPAAAR